MFFKSDLKSYDWKGHPSNEWFDLSKGTTARSGTVQAADGQQAFKAPRDAVLYLQRVKS